jgi:hypothetical protein
MSYKALIDSNLRKAFILIKDLAKDVTFSKKTIGDFDFALGEVSSETSTDTIVKAVIIKATKGDNRSVNINEFRNASRLEVMFKREDLGDVTNYDTVTIDSAVWKVGSPVKDDGYISILELHKEV